MFAVIVLLESYIVSRYDEEEKDEALRIDRAARWVFPLSYVALIAAAVLQT